MHLALIVFASGELIVPASLRFAILVRPSSCWSRQYTCIRKSDGHSFAQRVSMPFLTARACGESVADAVGVLAGAPTDSRLLPDSESINGARSALVYVLVAEPVALRSSSVFFATSASDCVLTVAMRTATIKRVTT